MSSQFGVQIVCIIVFIIAICQAQVPPRLQIPGAVLVAGGPRPSAGGPNPILRQRLQQYDSSPVAAPSPARLRGRPVQQFALPQREVRPVVEEVEEEPRQQVTSSHFDEEAARFGLTALNIGVTQTTHDDGPEPIAFRPERPLPVLRQDFGTTRQFPTAPKPVPITRPIQPSRQEFQESPIQYRKPTPQPIRSSTPQVPVRVAPTRPQRPIHAPQYLDEDGHRTRKPPVQILRKYRTDNADGSITWGYENEDGSFKEETIGNDCITRGKYGYIDPDGVKREYTYETPGKCEEPEPDEDDLPLGQKNVPINAPKKPYRLPLN